MYFPIIFKLFKYFTVTEKVHGPWQNTSGCITFKNDTHMKPCGKGRLTQYRSCDDGEKTKCDDPDDNKRFIDCSLSDCPGIILYSYFCLGILYYVLKFKKCLISNTIFTSVHSLVWK